MKKRKTNSKPKAKKKGGKLAGWKTLPWWRKVLRLVWVVPLALWLLSIMLVVAYKWVNPPLTPLMVQRFNQQLFQKNRPVNFEHKNVKVDDVSHYMVDCVIASEDGLFMYHHGFDVKQLKQSYKENKRGRRIRGGSTISMQTAKNVFLPHKRSMWRKAVEAYYTQLIEWFWGKKRIMEVYLNVIEFGDGIYGVEAASQHYYSKHASELTRHEAAELAVSLPAPLRRNPGNPSAYFRKRTRAIEGRSKQYGRINLDAKKENLNPKYRKQENIIDFVKWYRKQKAEGGK